MKTLFKNPLGSHQHSNRSRTFAPARFRPGLEHLEDRWMPAVLTPAPGDPFPEFFTCRMSSDGHTLLVFGTSKANDVVITQNDFANTLTVDYDGFSQVFAGSPITKIKLDLGAGGDSLEHNLVGDYSFSKTLDYKLGDGKDELKMDFRGTGTAIGEYLDIKLDAGIGNDTVTASFGRKQGGHLNFEAKMKDGNDKVFVDMKGDIQAGADVLFDLRGGNGNDTFTTINYYDENDGASSVDISSTSTLTIKINGGGDQDSLAAGYGGSVVGGKLFGDLTVLLEGGAGNDTVTAELFLRDGSTGDVDAQLLGGSEDDRMYLKLVEQPGSNVNLVNAILDGGTGVDDRYDASATTANVTKLNFDGSY